MSRIIISGSGEIYLDDYKSIIKISSDEIVISCKKYVLIVTGSNLSVCDYNVNCMVIRGRIRNVSWSD